jgi:hypothetical protein
MGWDAVLPAAAQECPTPPPKIGNTAAALGLSSERSKIFPASLEPAGCQRGIAALLLTTHPSCSLPAELSSPHSFHREVSSSARLLSVNPACAALRGAHTQTRAVLASAPSGSASLRGLTAPPCAQLPHL